MSFDRELAERFPSESPHDLEKIVQAGFELPAPIGMTRRSPTFSWSRGTRCAVER